MAINIASNFKYSGSLPNFERDLFNTIEEMANYPETSLPDIFITTNKEDGKIYLYNIENVVDPKTGRWRVVNSESSGGDSNNEPSWEENKGYVFGDIVSRNGSKYQAIMNHTSTTFEEDADNWVKILETYILVSESQYDYLKENNLLDDKLYVRSNNNELGTLTKEEYDSIWNGIVINPST